MINVALIDDHIVVRSGFAQLLSLEPDMQVVGQYASAASAWSSLLRMNIDVAVMDIDMPDESGLNLLARLRQKRPDMTPPRLCKARCTRAAPICAPMR